MNVREIVRNWLIDHGYDGLAKSECGCGGDNLFCCNEDSSECMPAMRHVRKEEDSICKECAVGSDGDCNGFCYRGDEEYLEK